MALDEFSDNRMDPFLCNEGTFYIENNVFKTIISVHVICSFIAIFVNLWFLRYGFRKVYFHRNVKVIMAFSLAANMAHSVFCLTLQSTHLYLYLTSTSGCDVIVPVQLCLSLRQPMNITMMSFVPLNVAIAIERAVATWRANSYEKCTSFFGFHLSILAMVASICIIFGSQHKTPITGYELYCSAVNSFTINDVAIASWVAMGFDLGAIFCFYFCWCINKNRRKRLIFDVTTAYQVSENLASLSLLLPWMIFHFIMFFFFNIANAIIPLMWNIATEKMIVRPAYAAVYIIPIYCMLSPYLLSQIVQSQKKSRAKQLQRLSTSLADTSSYEAYLKRQWY